MLRYTVTLSERPPRARHIAALLITVTACFCTATAAGSNTRTLEILGWVEPVRLAPGNLRINAKLDTGADTSSINAPKAEEFERNDEPWVRFSVENEDGEIAKFERPVVRMVRIRSASGLSRRHVVEMRICMAGIERKVEVNLADRRDLNYQMLIGRSYLKGHILVDPGKKSTNRPDCKMEEEAE